MLALSCLCLVSADEAPSKDEKTVTLMGMLMEWHYPDAEFGGGQMSDAGVTGVASIKCKSVLTTPDPADKVLAFYLKKLHVNKEGVNLDQKGTERVTTDRSVLVQTVSDGRFTAARHRHQRPHRRKANVNDIGHQPSTGEGKTRIAWSCYRQLGP